MNEISRREALKRGAVIGASVLWVTPAVQGVSMMRSAAAATSPPPDQPTYYAVKIDDDGCSDIWDQVGRDQNPNASKGKCLTPNAGALAVVPGGCGVVKSFETYFDDETDWTVTLAKGCEIVGDGSLAPRQGRKRVRPGGPHRCGRSDVVLCKPRLERQGHIERPIRHLLLPRRRLTVALRARTPLPVAGARVPRTWGRRHCRRVWI